MSRFIGALVAVCVFTLGCEQSNRVLSLPTSPSGGTPAPAPAPTPTPSPLPLPPVEFREITVGQMVNGVVSTTPPECVGEPGWPCQYFRLTAPSDGRLTVELRYKPDTQPPGRGGSQGVDVSVTNASGGEVWAGFFDPNGVTIANLNVQAGVIHQITLWYTFPRLEYELQTTLER